MMLLLLGGKNPRRSFPNEGFERLWFLRGLFSEPFRLFTDSRVRIDHLLPLDRIVVVVIVSSSFFPIRDRQLRSQPARSPFSL